MAGSLATIEPGLEASLPVTRLTHTETRCVLAYYTLCPLSADGEKLLYFEYDRAQVDRRQPGPIEGWIVVANADGSSPQRFDKLEVGGGASGALQLWCGRGRRFAYTVSPSTGVYEWGVIEPDTGKRWHGEGIAREATPDGNQVFVQQGEHIHLLHDNLTPDDVKTQLIDIESGQAMMTITLADVIAVHPEGDRLADEHLCFKQNIIASTGEHVAVVLSNAWYRGAQGESTYRHELLLANSDGTNIRCLGTFATHPSWHPSGKWFCAIVADEVERQLVFRQFPVDGGAPRTFGAGTLAAGHPSIQPVHERYLVNDEYGDGIASIYLYDLQAGGKELIVRAKCEDNSNDSGTHLHPAWSRDGRSFFFNADHLGPSQMYRVDLPG